MDKLLSEVLAPWVQDYKKVKFPVQWPLTLKGLKKKLKKIVFGFITVVKVIRGQSVTQGSMTPSTLLGAQDYKKVKFPCTVYCTMALKD